jgi:hypothetical protein
MTISTSTPPFSPFSPSAMAAPSLYSYSSNNSSSTVSPPAPPPPSGLRSSVSSSIRQDARHSPHSSLPAGTPVPPQASGAGIIERPLNRARGAEVALSAWAFLFAETVAYSQSRADTVSDLEKRCVETRSRWRRVGFY